MKINYCGGLYDGSVRKAKSSSNRKGKQAAKHRFMPHGWGFYEFKGDVSYTGYFHNGFEHGWGRLTWSTGDTYECYFRKGRPEATSLKLVKKAKKLKTQVSKLTASLIETQENLSLEEEKTMQVALSLDRAQDRCQALYNLALSAEVDAGHLNAIRDSI